jgi:hypothetical protein
VAEARTSSPPEGDDLSLGAIYRDLLHHPAFPAAARAICANQLALAERQPDISELYLDAGRYVSAMLAISSGLDEGLKLARFQAMCRDSLWMSPGRARSHVQLLQYLKYLERSGQRTNATYHVTERFRESWIAHYRAALGAAALIEPCAGAVAAWLDDPALFRDFMSFHISALLETSAHTPLVPGIAEAFLHPYAGSHLTWIIMTSGEEPCCPPRQFDLPSISQLSKRFRVSRTHIKRLIANASAAGLVAEISPGRWRLSESAAEGLADLFRLQLACLIHASVTATVAHGRGRWRPADRPKTVHTLTAPAVVAVDP